MLREITRIRGHVVFEVTTTNKKVTRTPWYRVFPVKGLGLANFSSPDFPDQATAERSIPWFREIDHIGVIGVYKTLNPQFYICAPRGASDEDLAAVLQKHYDLTSAKRAAALANYKATPAVA